MAGVALSACKGHHAASMLCPGPHSDFVKVPWLKSGKDVWRIGPESGHPVVLLHEVPGLTDDDLALARCLSKEGFNVYVPVLFGFLGQDLDAVGLAQACLGVSPPFECSKLSTRSTILDSLEPTCDQIADHDKRPIGVIGMCLTGVLPLALLPNHVTAAVLCQPTLPFDFRKRKPDGPQLTDLGLGDVDLQQAVDSTVPFLLMHYTQDPLSPSKRIETFGNKFGERVAIIELPGEGRHSSLAADLHPQAFADAVNYLKVRLDPDAGPKAMEVAKLKGRMCEITKAGTWRAV
jgi:dienelactone hydrolase